MESELDINITPNKSKADYEDGVTAENIIAMASLKTKGQEDKKGWRHIGEDSNNSTSIC